MDTVNKNGKFPSNYKVSPIDFEKDKPLQTKPCLSRGKRELDVTYMIYDWLPYWKHCPKSSALNSDSLSSDIFELLAEDVGSLQIKRVFHFWTRLWAGGPSTQFFPYGSLLMQNHLFVTSRIRKLRSLLKWTWPTAARSWDGNNDSTVTFPVTILWGLKLRHLTYRRWLIDI